MLHVLTVALKVERTDNSTFDASTIIHVRTMYVLVYTRTPPPNKTYTLSTMDTLIQEGF